MMIDFERLIKRLNAEKEKAINWELVSVDFTDREKEIAQMSKNAAFSACIRMLNSFLKKRSSKRRRISPEAKGSNGRKANDSRSAKRRNE